MISDKKIFDANIDTVPQMMSLVEQLCEGMPSKAAYDITLVCEEILVNIASYAYPDGEGELTLHWENDTERRVLTLVFEDAGVPFNPLLQKEPELSVPFQERKIGGLGIMMVRQRMDDVQYACREGKNILTVTKGY